MSLDERQKLETEMGLGKIGKQYPTTPALPPSAWRRTLKPWAALMLGIALGGVVAGVLSVFVEVVR